MPAVETKSVQEILDSIELLREKIKTAGNVGRTKSEALNVDDVLKEVPQKSGKVEEADWVAFTEDQQRTLTHRLEQIRDSLHIAAGLDGPRETSHIMHSAYASNSTIVIWCFIAIILSAGLLWQVVMNWGGATGTDLARQVQGAIAAIESLDEVKAEAAKADEAVAEAEQKARKDTLPANQEKLKQEVDKALKAAAASHAKIETSTQTAKEKSVAAIRSIKDEDASEARILTMVVLLGALGGTLHFVGSLVKFVGNRQLMRSWLIYYISMPIVGALLAPIVYMLLRVGLLAPTSPTADGSSISNLNLIGIYAFAALTGLFAKTATEKLGEVFGTMFQTRQPKAKDPLTSQAQPPGAPGSS